MARTWEPLPRAEATVATYRQASTPLPPGLIPIRAGAQPARKTLTSQAGQTYSYTAGLVGREYGFGEEPGSGGASLLNRKVYLVGSVNLAVACWSTAVRWRKIGASLRLTRKNDSSENEHVESNSYWTTPRIAISGGRCGQSGHRLSLPCMRCLVLGSIRR